MSEFVQSLARGISVVRSFSSMLPADPVRCCPQHWPDPSDGPPTPTDPGGVGYVRSDGRYFELTARILDIGYSYVASLNLNDIAQPYLESFSEVVRESSSVSVLDDTDIVYIARVPTKRIMTVAIGLGSRIPSVSDLYGTGAAGRNGRQRSAGALRPQRPHPDNRAHGNDPHGIA